MSAAPRVHLVVLPPDAVKGLGDTLRCEPFAALGRDRGSEEFAAVTPEASGG